MQATWVTALPPARRTDLVLALDEGTRECVVKDPVRRTYYRFGEQEHFLLSSLDGRRTFEVIQSQFHEKFAETLAEEDFDDFLETLRERRLISGAEDLSVGEEKNDAAKMSPPPRTSGSVLAFRAKLVDPDRLFTKLAPRIRFFWTPAFVMVASLLVLIGAIVTVNSHREFAAAIPHAFTWKMALLAWLTVVAATFLHESAHGLTCKYFGGDVHEIGFLFLYFTPCFYCDVSDAWMMPQTRKRLWIMVAGSAIDLVLWAVALIVWRLTVPNFLLHDLAWIVASVCGVRIFFNMNPLIKLDGYYILSDCTKIPNLRQRSWDRAAAMMRNMLWGAPRPAKEPHERFLLIFGVVSWTYCAMLVALMLYALLHLAVWRFGYVGIVPVVIFGLTLVPAMFAGVSSGEVTAMFQKRRKWAMGWGFGLAALGGVMLLGTMQDTAAGGFKVRAARHVEVRAPVTGYLRQVNVDEGMFIEEGKTLVVMEIPDVVSRLEQKRSEVKEFAAKLKAHDTGIRTLPPDSIRLLAEKNVHEQERAAAEAHVKAVEAEVAFLESQVNRQTIGSPVSGQMLTPRVSEKIGQYLKDGELICEMEDPRKLEIEISVLEQDALRIKIGQKVTIKPRASASETFTAHVVRLAPVAQPGETQSTMAVYCTLDEPTEALRSGMTGVARIECGRDRIALVLARRVRHFLRTEFWW